MTQTLEQLQKEYDQVLVRIHGYRSNTIGCTTEEYNQAFNRGTELLRLMREERSAEALKEHFKSVFSYQSL